MPLLSSILPAAAGAIGSVFSGLFGNNQQKQSQRFQAEQNQLNRDFQMSMFNQANDYNTMMYERMLRDNSPSVAVSKLREAGLNPSLYYSGSTSMTGPVASSSPAPSGSSSITGVSPTMENPVDAYNRSKLAAAQARLAESQADKVDKDTYWTDALNENLISTNEASIRFNDQMASYSKEQEKLIRPQIELLGKQLEQMSENISLIRANVDKTNTDTQEKALQIAFRSATFQDEVKSFALRNKLTEAQVYSTLGQLMISQRLCDSQVDLQKVLGRYYNASAEESVFRQINLITQGERLEFDLSQDKRFESLERGVGVARGFVSLFSELQNLYLRPLEFGFKALGSLK